MGLINKNLLREIVNHDLSGEIFRGRFGVEKENIRVDKEGKLALTPHPEIFGIKAKNPYISADFSESQVEMITPVFDSVKEAYEFLEALQNIVSLELKDEYLWPSSNPPILPDESSIPVADMGDEGANEYRKCLAAKYEKKRLCLSGVHFNFSFRVSFLEKLHRAIGREKSFREFKDELYLKVARNFARYRWLVTYLTGAGPVFHKSYMEQCVGEAGRLNEEDCYFPNMNSLRNSKYGYRNKEALYVPFTSVEEYAAALKEYIDSGDLISVKEFYSMIRLKGPAGSSQLESLLRHGVEYLEIRTADLNPFDKNGISLSTLEFLHLFLVYLLLADDRPYGEEEHRMADYHLDLLCEEGITATLDSNRGLTMQDAGLAIVEEMMEMVRELGFGSSRYMDVLEEHHKALRDPSYSLAARIKKEIERSSFIEFHLNKAKQYKEECEKHSFRLPGFEDLELSTQILLKAAIKRGIAFEILDRKENFISLTKDGHTEYVKQATKTSLDSYVTVLIMENKTVTKKVLARHGIRVPKGREYDDVDNAVKDFALYQDQPIVIKPKTTNFGIGVTIFTGPFSKEDYETALRGAFRHDKTVLVEEFLTGKEYRFLVIGDEVIGVLHRVPANVVGDGVSTIEELVREKNKDPLRGTGYRTPLEKIRLGETEELFLKGQGKTRTDIPKKGEIVYLRENSNISTGGDSIDYTDEMPDSYKDIAVRAAKAVGAVFCGVDMVIDDIGEEAGPDNYGIIEINFNPAIHIHCYPYKGKNRHPEEKILALLGFGNKEAAKNGEKLHDKVAAGRKVTL